MPLREEIILDTSKAAADAKAFASRVAAETDTVAQRMRKGFQTTVDTISFRRASDNAQQEINRIAGLRVAAAQRVAKEEQRLGMMAEVAAQRAARSAGNGVQRTFGSMGFSQQINQARGGRGGMANSGMAMLQVGQFMDDAQYGLRGVVNNMPSLVTSLGGSLKMAGGIGIAAVAANQIWGIFEKKVKASLAEIETMKGAGDRAQEVASGLQALATASDLAAQRVREVAAAQQKWADEIARGQQYLERDVAGIGRGAARESRRLGLLDEAARIRIGSMEGSSKIQAEGALQKEIAVRDTQRGLSDARRERDLTQEKRAALQKEAQALAQALTAAVEDAKTKRTHAGGLRGESTYSGYAAIAVQAEQKVGLMRARLEELTKGIEEYGERMTEVNERFADAVNEMTLLPQKLANIDAEMKQQTERMASEARQKQGLEKFNEMFPSGGGEAMARALGSDVAKSASADRLRREIAIGDLKRSGSKTGLRRAAEMEREDAISRRAEVLMAGGLGEGEARAAAEREHPSGRKSRRVRGMGGLSDAAFSRLDAFDTNSRMHDGAFPRLDAMKASGGKSSSRLRDVKAPSDDPATAAMKELSAELKAVASTLKPLAKKYNASGLNP
ncbi:MAG: hypothetical protein KA004_17425 [Verrucomicrobiales bacterium]|nr:hypothetical protein [Verrucomicrobiales bacterium]